MRSGVFLWSLALLLAAAALSLTASRYAAARSRAASAHARFDDAVTSRVRLASLREALPAWTALRPSGGLAPRVADALLASGLPASAMANLSAQAETIIVPPGTSSPANTGSAGVKSRKASITLAPITLSQLGRFMDAWRQREPAWVIASVDLAPISPSGPTSSQVKAAGASAASSPAGTIAVRFSGTAEESTGGGELPLRVVLGLESLWLESSKVPQAASPVPSTILGDARP